MVAAVHEGDALAEPGQERGLLDRGVAAADHDDLLVAEEEPVAGGTPRDAAAGHPLLVVEAELAVRGAGGQDDGARLERLAAERLDRLDVTVEVEHGRVVPQHLGTELLGLLLQTLHQLGALDAVGEPGEVLHLGGVHQGAAGGDGPRDHQRGQAGACRVDRGGVAGRTRSDDDEIADGGGLVGHVRSLRVRRAGDGPAGADGINRS